MVTATSTRRYSRSNITCAFVLLILVVYVAFDCCRNNRSFSARNEPQPILNNIRKGGKTILSNNLTTAKELQEEKKQCNVWMAPSSLVGNAGYGIFTTRNLQRNQKILAGGSGSDGISIPLEALEQDDTPNWKQKNLWLNVWGNFYWGRGVPDHVSFLAPTDTADFLLNFGILPNHHCILSKLGYHYPDPSYDDSMVNRYKDPGAGAFTYIKGREFIVTGDTMAGEEIFLNYGYCKHDKWSPAWTKNIYMSPDFKSASKIILNYKRNKKGISFDEKTGTLINIPNSTKKLVSQLLPKTMDDFEELTRNINNEGNLMKRLAETKSITPRSPDWIRENGMCIENLIPQKSTLPQAGQGAFAQYPIKKGEIVVPVPLLQIVDKEALTLYDTNGTQIGKQLLINYCFGHEESTLLLCPQTNAALINHCSKRESNQKCNGGANAEYRWSSGWDKDSDLWREKSIVEIAKENGRGLAFEIVATRDIVPGEEVFIDYGADWEEAWEEHVANWKPPEDKIKPFVTVKEANSNNGDILDMLVSGNLRKNINHPYLFTGCQYWPSEDDEHRNFQKKHRDWRKWSDDKILQMFSDDGDDYTYDTDLGYKSHGDQSHWPCSVLHQDEKEGKYTVRIHQSPWHDTQDWFENGLPRILTNYPRESIHYFVQPYESDQHLHGTFRHPIGIRDDIFPSHWKNRPKKANNGN